LREPPRAQIGLLGGFVRSLEVAAGKAGQLFKKFLAKAGNKFRAAKEQVRKYRLFAKDKTKEAKDKMVAQMANIVAGINRQLGKVLAAGAEHGRKLRGQAVVARRKLGEWHVTMGKLVPQIRYWLRTGFVAAGKIINLHVPELYSVVRGKVGKSVEFGLSWGITRLRGGFVLATMAGAKKDLTDATYDRLGSARNVERLRELGVREVGLAPRARRRGKSTKPPRLDSSRNAPWSRVRSAPSNAPSTDSIAPPLARSQ
jgi:hypothetical protein